MQRLEVLKEFAEISASVIEPSVALERYLVALQRLDYVDHFRLYRIARDPFSEPGHEDRMYIIAASPNNVHRLGYSLRVGEATFNLLGESSKPFAPVLGSPLDHADNAPAFIHDLDLHKQTWLDVPLRGRSSTVGLLSIDWSEDRLPPSDISLALLSVMASAIAETISAIDDQLSDQLVALVADSYSADTTTTETALVSQVLSDIDENLRLGHGAAFQYQPSSGCVVKFAETSKTPSPAESYCDTTSLTGKAWNDRSYHFIPDFSSVPRALVDQPNLGWIKANYGEPTSVRYLRLGAHGRYLLRFISCDTQDYGRYFSEAYALGETESHLAALVSSTESERRRFSLQRCADLSTSVFNPDRARSLLVDTMGDEGYVPFAVALSQTGSTGLLVREFHGPNPGTKLPSLGHRTSWSEDRILGRFSNGRSSEPVAATESASSVVSRWFHEQGAARISGHPINVGSTHGSLLLGLPARGDNSLHVPPDGDAHSFITSVCRSLAQDVDHRVARIVSEGANRALGVIGHEMGTPIAAHRALANHSLLTVRERLQELAGLQETGSESADDLLELDNTIRNLTAKLAEEAASIEASLDAAHSVASMEARVVRVEFVERSLTEALNAAVITLRNEMGANQYLTPAVVFREPSARSLPSFPHDWAHSKAAFLNVLRNAAKFSQVGARIRIWAEEQQNLVDIAIENVGPSIPEHLAEPIFGSFVRAADSLNDDELTQDIGGLGVGLYVARCFMRAHGGDVFIRSGTTESSQPVADTSVTFVLRFPTDLLAGSFQYRFEPNSLTSRSRGSRPRRKSHTPS